MRDTTHHAARSHNDALRADSDQSQLFAAQAAADFLGIHRSTLYLAVRRLKLIPDAYTPGGHARFRRETLERFSERLTLDSATGGEGCIARAVASAAASLLQCTQLEPVAEAVVEAALSACPGFSVSMALICDDDAPCPDQPRLLAQRGLSQRMAAQYNWLRRRPGVGFINSVVVRTGERYISSDVFAPDATTPEGARAVLGAAGYRSCAALPCVARGVTLGALICLGRTPYTLSEPEISALGALSDTLAVALRRARRERAIERQTIMISSLMCASGQADSADDPISAIGDGDSSGRLRLDALERIFRVATRARLARWWPGAGKLAETPAPLAQALRSAAALGAPQRVEWSEDDAGVLVALASPAASGQGAFGALWRRQDMRSGMELAALQMYAQLYLHIAGQGELSAPADEAR